MLTQHLLETGLRRTVPDRWRVRRQMTVVLDPRNAPEPDLSLVRSEAVRGPMQDHYPAADVLLAVEVAALDTAARDRSTKPRKYAAAGIPHFWLAEMAGDDDHPAVHTYELDPVTKAYAPTGIHHERLKLSVPFTIGIDLTEVDRL